jgi:hypothetical protein
VAAGEVGRGIVRINLEGLAGIGDRLVRHPPCRMGRATRHIRSGKLCIDLDRLVLAGNGLVKIALSPLV